uniref:3-hydroxybutyryl-CoA dehydrogenase n=1 Tax=Arcella intermedia TaxID=1963864 RepID=A0A6B2LCH6_9EUKA
MGIVGSGQMGSGIAKVAMATAQLDVLLVDNNANALSSAAKGIEGLIAKDVAKGKLTADLAKAATARLKTTTQLGDLKDVDFVIEAVSEVPALKDSLFRELDRVCPPHAILASNTSSISITRIGSNTKRAEKVIGMHFMNPVPVMKLVEVIPSLATSQETAERTLALAKAMEKVTTKSEDIAGFIANRLLCPYLNEAFVALGEGLGTKEDIDTTLKLGCNMPMGPLTLADFIGLDTVLAIMNVLHKELGDKYKPSPLLVRYVEAGWLGKKVGRGVFTYETK